MVVISPKKVSAVKIFPSSLGLIEDEAGQVLCWAHIFREGISKEEAELRAWIALDFACNCSMYTKDSYDNGRDVSCYIETFRKYANQAEKPLEYFQTTEQEIAEIIRCGFLAEAFLYLQLTVKHIFVAAEEYQNKMRAMLEKAGEMRTDCLGIMEEDLPAFLNDARRT